MAVLAIPVFAITSSAPAHGQAAGGVKSVVSLAIKNLGSRAVASLIPGLTVVVWVSTIYEVAVFFGDVDNRDWLKIQLGNVDPQTKSCDQMEANLKTISGALDVGVKESSGTLQREIMEEFRSSHRVGDCEKNAHSPLAKISCEEANTWQRCILRLQAQFKRISELPDTGR